MSLSCTVCEIRYDTIQYIYVRSKADETEEILYTCGCRCKMHDSDFEVLITTRFREKIHVHHYRACLDRLTRTVTHCTHNLLLFHTRSSATAERLAMLVNQCCVSRAVGGIKVSDGKSDLQGHSRSLTSASVLVFFPV